MTLADTLRYFRQEAQEATEGLEKGLLSSELGEIDIRELFRLAHNLKGAARAVEQVEIADLAHTLEDVLAHHRDTAEPLTSQERQELLLLVDAMRRAMPPLEAKVGQSTSEGPRENAQFDRLRIDLGDMDSLASIGAGGTGARCRCAAAARRVWRDFAAGAVPLCDCKLRECGVEIVGEASTGRQAVALCASLEPDVVTLDIVMPDGDGVEATEEIMSECPTPILVVSSADNRGDAYSTLRALSAGAVDALEKPLRNEPPLAFDERFRRSLRIVSRVSVVTRRARRQRVLSVQPPMAQRAGVSREVVAIGASTGGPSALVELLGELPGCCFRPWRRPSAPRLRADMTVRPVPRPHSDELRAVLLPEGL